MSDGSVGEPDVAVFAPSIFLSLTIEEGAGPDEPEIHLHPGGQGIWIARLLSQLGAHPVVCTPLGGESGSALRGLTREWSITLDPILTESSTSARIEDRRGSSRQEIGQSPVPKLTRHDADELYGRVLERSMAAGCCVIVGRFAPENVPIDLYRRLGADLGETDVQAIGDLHGEELQAFLTSGRFRWLKVSDEDLVADDVLDDADRSLASAGGAARQLAERGCDGVLVSRAGLPAVACAEGELFQIDGPTLEVVDNRGAGDSMTAALAASVVRDLPFDASLQLAWAAGAANVTRHGFGTASPSLIDELAPQVAVGRLGAD